MKVAIKISLKYIKVASALLLLLATTQIMPMYRASSLQTPEQRRALAAKQAVFRKMQEQRQQEELRQRELAAQSIKPIMPQQQLFAQKNELQNLVKNVWENCLKALDEKLSGLAVQDPGYENIVVINDSFEKQPKTDAHILFIKNTVKNIIAQTPMPSIQFDQKIKNVQEQALKSILEGIVTNALVELILQDPSESLGKSLDWCPCIPAYKRLTLIVLLINDIREKFTNKNQQIVYTSFASGNLLLDYVALSELLLSHTNILVNLIDLEYPDIPELTKKNLRKENPHDLHMLEMKNKQENADIIDNFKTKIAQIISEKPATINYNFDVNIYQNAYDYISYIQKNPQEKSNILILVDPSVFTFGIADFPALANVINIWVDEENAPVFTIYLPRHHGAHLYQAKVNDFSKIESLRKQLSSLMETTGVSKKYTSAFTNALLAKSIFDQQITDELLAKSFPRLMEIKAQLKEGALKVGYADSDLLNPLTPIKLGDVPVLVSWGTDAHMSFQDMVWDALAPHAVVYELYAVDPNKYDDSNKQIIQVNPEMYKKADVITPNAGAAIKERVRVEILSAPAIEQPTPATKPQPQGLWQRITSGWW